MDLYEELEFLRSKVRDMRRAQCAVSESYENDDIDNLVRNCIELEDEVDKLVCPVDVSLPDGVIYGEQLIYFGGK